MKMKIAYGKKGWISSSISSCSLPQMIHKHGATIVGCTYFLDMSCVQGEIEPKSSQMNPPFLDLVQDEPIVHISQASQFAHVQIIPAK